MIDDPFAPPDQGSLGHPPRPDDAAPDPGPIRADLLRRIAGWQAAASLIWVLVGGVSALVALLGELMRVPESFGRGTWIAVLGLPAATLSLGGGFGLAAAALALTRDPLRVLRANTRLWRVLVLVTALAAGALLVGGPVLVWLDPFAAARP